MPGSFPTSARRFLQKRLNKVDLPTLGRPRITIRGRLVMSKDETPKTKEAGEELDQGDYHPGAPCAERRGGSDTVILSLGNLCSAIANSQCAMLPWIHPSRQTAWTPLFAEATMAS